MFHKSRLGAICAMCGGQMQLFHFSPCILCPCLPLSLLANSKTLCYLWISWFCFFNLSNLLWIDTWTFQHTKYDYCCLCSFDIRRRQCVSVQMVSVYTLAPNVAWYTSADPVYIMGNFLRFCFGKENAQWFGEKKNICSSMKICSDNFFFFFYFLFPFSLNWNKVYTYYKFNNSINFYEKPEMWYY